MPEFDILAKVIEISHLEESAERKLTKILDYLKERLEFCNIHFLLFKKEFNMFQLNYSTDKEIAGSEKKIAADDALFEIINSKKNVFINGFNAVEGSKSDFITCGNEKVGLFVLPVFTNAFFFGVLLGEKRGDFTKLEEKLLSLISTEIAGMICSASAFFELNEKVYELSSLSIDGKHQPLEELCKKITEHVCALLYANTIFIELFAPGIDDIDHQRSVYNRERSYQIDNPLIKSIIEEVKKKGQPIYIKSSLTDKKWSERNPDFMSALFVPIEYNFITIGVIGAIDKETGFFINERHFTERDFNVLISLSNQIASYIENLIVTKEKEIKTRELKVLYDVSKVMMTTMKLDTLLHKILTAVTIGGGLGFNRAGLFLVNHRMNSLQGMLGMGPDSGEEANKIWTALAVEKKTLLQWMSAEEENKGERKSKLDESIKAIRVSLEEEDEPLIQAIKQKRGLLFKSSDGYKSKSLEKLNPDIYAVVPLVAKDRVLGAIYVDNYITKRAITDEDLNFLTLFANQAGLAIENSTLYSNLKKANEEIKEANQKILHSEKLAALGEMAADIAHEIKNPLTSIGGFARRLSKRFPEKTDEKRYANIIMRESSRLEKILNEILNFSKEEKADNFKFNDINSIINETLISFDNEFLENNINVVINLQSALPKVKCDYYQVRQALVNLLNNSCQAMPNSGTLRVSSRKALLNNKEAIVIEISDTGGGVNAEVLHNIFNPFFTTKDGGTGLGLAITHRFIANHGGCIEVDNKPGFGVTFIIKLPTEKGDSGSNKT